MSILLTEPERRERRSRSLERRRLRLERRLARVARRVSLLARSRALAFLVAAALVAAAVPFPEQAGRLQAAGALGFAVFLGLVVLHRGPRRAERRLQGVLAAVERDELRALGRWSELPRTGEGLAGDCLFATDLSLFGRWSLFQAISRCATPFGEQRLAALLTAPPSPVELPSRQAAARELARREGFRHRLEAEGRLGALEGASPELVVRLLAGGPSLHDERPWLAPLARVLVGLTALQGLLALTTDWPSALGLFLVAQLAVFLATRRSVEREYLELLAHENAILAWSEMLRLVESRRFREPLLARLRDAVEGASGALEGLAGSLQRLSARATLMHPIVNILFLWDLLETARLRRWRQREGRRAADWFRALGELEALASLGAHAADRVEPVFAGVAVEGPVWVGRGLVHPLLPAESAVPNELALEAEGTVLLLTGSNMSGKSTLLRTVGLNTVLGLAGGAVHASELRLRPCRLITSIHVTDALDAGVSLFYAEVRRIKLLLDAVDAADAADAAEGAVAVLYLVDEVLRGTNTRERLIASRAIIRRLADSRSTGLVTSHELGLAALEGELKGLRNLHFRESVTPDGMSFDYRLHEGPVRTSNALALLRQEGVRLDFDAEDSGA